MASGSVLLNGVLVEILLEPQTDINVVLGCALHVVNLGAPLVCNVKAEGSKCEEFALDFGSTMVIEFDSGSATLTFREPGPALNFTERGFANEVRHRLGAYSAQRPPSSTTANNKQQSNSIEGAACITTVVQNCDTRAPAHACELISALGNVNSFESAGGEKFCVAKKKSKPRSLQSCPRVESAIGIECIAKQAASGEAMWRQCAASFSTMMRQFQKAPSSFRWEADAQRRTIITKS